MNINIIGSCVTRDAFEVVKNSFKLNHYFARTSFISIMSEPLNIRESEINLKSNFQKACVLADLNNEFFKKIKTFSQQGVLIIDLIDERFNLIQLGNAYFTKSNEMVNSGFLDNNEEIIELNRLSSEVTELWYEKTKAFFEKLFTIYDKSKVIIHKTKWQSTYLDKFNNIQCFKENKGIQLKNDMLQKYYSFIEKEYPDLHIIDMTKNEYLADEKHNWGLAPYHFEKKYYLDFIKKLSEIEGIWSANYYVENTKMGQVNILYSYDAEKTYLDLGTTSNVKNSKDLKFDDKGIPMLKVGSNGQYGYQYYPITITIYGLELVSKYYVTENDKYLKDFFSICEYLVDSQMPEGSWPALFDYYYGVKESGVCRKPWVSALAQGFAISNLCRAYKLSNDEKYIATAFKAITLFEKDVTEGGVRRKLFNQFTFYEEYPTEIPTHILNGFMFALLGLYDLYYLTKKSKPYELYKEGVSTLEYLITMYDLGNVSSYDLSHVTIPGNPAKYHYGYHLTHIKLLSAFSIIEQNKMFEKVQGRWLSYAKGNKSFYKLEPKFIDIKVNSSDEYIFKDNVKNAIDIYYKQSGDYEYAAYIYKNGEKIFVKKYDSINKIFFEPTESDEYTLMIFIRDEFKNAISKTYTIKSTSKDINVDSILSKTFDELKKEVEVSINQGLLTVKLPQLNKGLTVAYYLSNSKGILEKKWYSLDNKYTYQLTEKDEYKCTIFLQDKNNKASFEVTINY